MIAGIYIHIPFCRSRCSYCDFATGIYQAPLAQRYVDALVKELQCWNEVEPASVDTIYFGGGTPSLLTSHQIGQILAAVRSGFDVLSSAEVTMEMNPGTTSVQSPKSKVQSLSDESSAGEGSLLESTPSALNAFRDLGVNRASFGAQTFDDAALRHLGRTHSAADIRRTFRDLRAAGFENINFDLIAGLPGQTIEDWSRNLDEALALRPEHLSLYLLDVHEATPLFDQIERGIRPRPDDDLAAEMYRLMIERVCAAGYEHYEISNFCLPGFASRHNTKYWTGLPYYGFGCSAHSYDGSYRRWSNERDIAGYIKAIEEGDRAIVERVELSERDVRAESIFLGLRMMSGINVRAYQARFGVNLPDEYRQDLTRFCDAGFIEVEDDFIKLTRDGALLSNEVFAAFL